MFEDKDYMMRIISEVIRMLAKLILGKDFDGSREEDLPVELVAQYQRFVSMVDVGEIDTAEDLLLENLDVSKQEYLQMGLMLYQHMNEKTEIFLKEHDFSKDEILDGVKYLVDFYGYSNLMQTLVEDDKKY